MKRMLSLAGMLVITGVVVAGCAPSKSSTVTPGATNTNTPTATATFTLADVAAHNTQASCYTAIRGNVYDLTDWIRNHPGGPGAIVGICGTDGTEKFSGKHGGQAAQEQQLATFQIGTLQQ
jgi:cytochrome b involved in lipid metabolism